MTKSFCEFQNQFNIGPIYRKGVKFMTQHRTGILAVYWTYNDKLTSFLQYWSDICKPIMNNYVSLSIYDQYTANIQKLKGKTTTVICKLRYMTYIGPIM